jgi:photosystem I subunit 4
MAKSEKNKQDSTKSTKSDSGYNTPIEPTQRHTGMYEEGDGRDEAQPESGSSKTVKEGAPNQGTEKR